MSSDSQDQTPDQRETQLTALLLGELPADKAEALRKAMELDPALAARCQRLAATIDLVRTAVTVPVQPSPQPMIPLTLSPERRERILQHFKTAAPVEFTAPSRKELPWQFQLGLAAALVALIGLTAVAAGIWQRTNSVMLASSPASASDARPEEPVSRRKVSVLYDTAMGEEKRASAAAETSARTLAAPATGPAAAPPVNEPTSAIRNESTAEAAGAFRAGGTVLERTPTRQAGEDVADLYAKDFGRFSNEANAARPALDGSALSVNGLETLNERIDSSAPIAFSADRQTVEPSAQDARARGQQMELAPSDNLATTWNFDMPQPSKREIAGPSGGISIPTLGDVPQLGRYFRETDDLGRKDAFDKQPSVPAPAIAAPTVEYAFGPKAVSQAGQAGGRPLMERERFGLTPPPPNKLSLEKQVDREEATPGEAARHKTLSTPAPVELGLLLKPAQQLPQVESAKKEDRKEGLRFRSEAGGTSLAESEILQQLDLKPAASPQPEVSTSANPFSTFSLNVADVSFRLAAASLEKGVMPEPASIRSEEFINAFNYRDPEPGAGQAVAFAWERARYPFAQDRDLVRFSIKTAALGREAGRPLNVVLVVDRSGSMERADRVRIVREALRVLGEHLQPADKLSIISFARTARLCADGVSGSEIGAALETVAAVPAEGGTNLEAALGLGYSTALRRYLSGGINRVVLLTDGAANLGNVDAEALRRLVESHRRQGVALDCFGIGWDGYNDDLMQTLSSSGDGRYGFLNTPEEATNSFGGQLAGALRAAASDVKVQVEFNPKRVNLFRQIGYAKHQLATEQFRDNTVDAAEIGAAESGNALYVVQVNPNGEGPLGHVRVRYRVSGTGEIQEQEWSLPDTGPAGTLDRATPSLRLAGVAAAFSEWLASSPYAAEVTPDRLLSLLAGVPQAYGPDNRPKTLEWMIRQTKSIGR